PSADHSYNTVDLQAVTQVPRYGILLVLCSLASQNAAGDHWRYDGVSKQTSHGFSGRRAPDRRVQRGDGRSGASIEGGRHGAPSPAHSPGELRHGCRSAATHAVLIVRGSEHPPAYPPRPPHNAIFAIPARNAVAGGFVRTYWTMRY